MQGTNLEWRGWNSSLIYWQVKCSYVASPHPFLETNLCIHFPVSRTLFKLAYSKMTWRPLSALHRGTERQLALHNIGNFTFTSHSCNQISTSGLQCLHWVPQKSSGLHMGARDCLHRSDCRREALMMNLSRKTYALQEMVLVIQQTALFLLSP